MFNIFNTGKNRKLNKIPLYPNINLNKIIFSQLIYFKKFMLEENFFMDNKHPLITLLSSCFSSSFMRMIPEEIAFTVADAMESVGNTMGLTTDRNRGRYFKEGNLSYLIYLENDFEIKSNNEGKYEIIKCMYTDYDVVDFSYNTEVREFMILRVNPVELMLDFVEWKKDRDSREYNTSYNVYIATRIIPMIWDTKTNLVMFNRFMKLYYKQPLTKYKNKHSIQIINREDMIDSDHRRFLDFLKGNKKTDVYCLLYGYEYLGKDMLEVLSFDEKIFLHHTIFLLFLSRAKYVSFLLDIIDSTGSKAINISYISELYVIFRRYHNGLVRMPELPNFVIDEYSTYIEKIKNQINYK